MPRSRAPGVGGHRVPKTALRDAGGRFRGAGILWTGLEVMADNINRHGKTLNETRKRAMGRLAQEMKDYMQENAPWNDRTGDAREMLQSVVIHDESQQTSTVWISHGAEYGIWLEITRAGENAIIGPTIEVFSGRMFSTVRSLESVSDILGRVYGDGDEE